MVISAQVLGKCHTILSQGGRFGKDNFVRRFAKAPCGCIIIPMPTDTHYPSYRKRLEMKLNRPIDARVRHIAIKSEALGVKKSFYVALPPGYGRFQNRELRYPTLYLFRGHEREWIHRWQDKSRHGRTVIDVYRELLDAKDVGPMILVFPGISSDDNRVPGLLVNFTAPELAKQAPGVGTGRFEDYFLNELIPCVDTMFRTVAERGGRAVDGFSLGGFQSVKIAAQHPDLFCSCGSFDGTFLYSTAKGKAVRANDRVLRNPMFAPAFGSPSNLDYVAANSPANLMWRTEQKALASVQWLIRSGPEKSEPWQSNYFRAQHVIEIMRARNLSNGVPSVFPQASHSWHWADTHIEGTLPLHWKAMLAARDGGRSANGAS